MTTYTALTRIRVAEASQVIVPGDVQLTAPAHWSAGTADAARKAGWSVYYVRGQDGRCWWDAERFSHVPASVALPLAVVAANAPAWWDADGAERGHNRCGSWFEPS